MLEFLSHFLRRTCIPWLLFWVESRHCDVFTVFILFVWKLFRTLWITLVNLGCFLNVLYKYIWKLKFFLLLNINAILKNVEIQTVASPQQGHIFSNVFLLSKSMWTSNVDCLVTNVFPNIVCVIVIVIVIVSTKINEYRFGTTCEWVNNDRNYILGSTIPLIVLNPGMFSSVPLRPARI